MKSVVEECRARVKSCGLHTDARNDGLGRSRDLQQRARQLLVLRGDGLQRKGKGGPPIDLYFGPPTPAGHEGEGIIPGERWFSYFRIYGPERAAFDGTWTP